MTMYNFNMLNTDDILTAGKHKAPSKINNQLQSLRSEVNCIMCKGTVFSYPTVCAYISWIKGK